jgi:DNA mismatch endonuclease (patch repair protein)
MRIRKTAHALGLRFRLHRKDLPGKPDLVFPKHKVALFVRGCFWHRHPGCSKTSTPKTRTDYWQAKFAANIQRDDDAETALAELGWRVVIIWECETVGLLGAEKIERLLNCITEDGGVSGKVRKDG